MDAGNGASHHSCVTVVSDRNTTVPIGHAKLSNYPASRKIQEKWRSLLILTIELIARYFSTLQTVSLIGGSISVGQWRVCGEGCGGGVDPRRGDNLSIPSPKGQEFLNCETRYEVSDKP